MVYKHISLCLPCHGADYLFSATMFLNPEKSSRFKAIGGTQAIVSILGQQRGESVGHGSHQVTTRVERNFVVFVYTARFDVGGAFCTCQSALRLMANGGLKNLFSETTC